MIPEQKKIHWQKKKTDVSELQTEASILLGS